MSKRQLVPCPVPCSLIPISSKGRGHEQKFGAAKASAIAGEPWGKADAALIRATTGFAIGGVAPIAHLTESPAFWDPKLSNYAVVYSAAATPRHVFGIAPTALLKLPNAQVADFKTQ